jgi:hypothetical protein
VKRLSQKGIIKKKAGLGTSTTGADHWSGPRGKREKGKLGWQRRIEEEGFRIFKIFF